MIVPLPCIMQAILKMQLERGWGCSSEHTGCEITGPVNSTWRQVQVIWESCHSSWGLLKTQTSICALVWSVWSCSAFSAAWFAVPGVAMALWYLPSLTLRVSHVDLGYPAHSLHPFKINGAHTASDKAGTDDLRTSVSQLGPVGREWTLGRSSSEYISWWGGRAKS